MAWLLFGRAKAAIEKWLFSKEARPPPKQAGWTAPVFVATKIFNAEGLKCFPA